MPSVLSCSSTPSHRVRFHSPARRSRSACGMLRAWASSNAMVCSAADSTFDWGAFTTITPRRVAASTSTLSRPMPARPTTTSSSAGFEHLGRDLGRAADHERRRAPHRVEQLLGREPEPHVDLEAGAAHGLEPALGELLGDQHAVHRAEARRSARSSPERLAGATCHATTPEWPSGLPREELRRCARRPRPGRRRRGRTTGGRSRARRTPRRARSRPWPRRAAARTARASWSGVRPASSRPSTPSNEGKQ